MRRNRIEEIPNLKDLTFTQTKKLARNLCPDKTDSTLAELTGLPRATIQRIFQDPDYHPTMPHIPGLCGALGNNLMIQWPAAQVGGYLVFPPSSRSESSLQHYIAKITKEFSDVLEQDAKAKQNASPGGQTYTACELAAIRKELDQLGEKIETAKLVLTGLEKGEKKKSR